MLSVKEIKLKKKNPNKTAGEKVSILSIRRVVPVAC